MQRADLVMTRLAAPEDVNFIFATMLRGLYYGDSWFSKIPKDIFMAHYHKVIEALLTHPSTVVSVACLKDDPEVVLGYAIANKTGEIAHFVYVKSAWRNIGLAKSLVVSPPKSVSHLTTIGASILKKHPEVIFNPFQLT